MNAIAETLGIAPSTVRLWRRRYSDSGPDGLLHDAPGRGRKPVLDLAARQALRTGTGTGDPSTVRNTTVTGDITVTLPTEVHTLLTGPGTVHLAAATSWVTGTVSLAGGLEVLAGQTLTFPNNGQFRVLSGTSLRNHGTVAMGSGNVLRLQGGTTVAVTNEADGLWTLDAGSSAIDSNGAGTLSFANAGTMQGPGAASTTLTIGSFISFSSSGTISGINLVFVP